MTLYLLGAGGHCRSVIDVIETIGGHTITGIIGQADEVGTEIMGYSVCGSDADLEKFVSPGSSAFVTVGQIKSAELRQALFEKLLNLDIDIPVLISPHAHLSAHSDVRVGTILMHGSVVNSCAEIGNNCIINSMALVEHDVRVGDHSHIATRTTLNGGVRVGSSCFIGSGSIVKEGVSIGDSVVIGAGSLVLKDVPAESFVTGVFNG